MPEVRSSRAEHMITKMELGELRWLVNQCEGMPDNSKVTVQAYKYHSPMDSDQAYIKVSGNMPD